MPYYDDYAAEQEARRRYIVMRHYEMTKLIAARGRTFNPVNLFAHGETGGLWDPSDLSTLFQADGTTPVASDGDAVGLMQDKSGNGDHLIQATVCPLYHTSGGLKWIETDGVDDFLGCAYVQSAYPLTLMAGMLTTVGGTGVGATLSVYGGAFNVYMSMGAFGDTTSFVAVKRNTGQINTDASTVSATVPYVGLAEFRTDDFFAHQVNNNAPSPDKSMAGAAFGTASNIFLGKTRDSGLFTGLKFYGGLVINRLLTPVEKDGMRKWLASRMGISL